MREVGVASQFSAPDLGSSFGLSIINSLCQDWLLRIELNLNDSEITFGAVKWAIAELQRAIEQYQGYDLTSDYSGSSSSGRDDDEWVSGRSSSKLRSGTVDRWGRSGGGDEVENGRRIDSVEWRNMLIEAGGCTEEPDQGDLNSGGDSRARVSKFVFSSALKEAVIAAEGGEAGRRMAERVTSSLEQPELMVLTKLVSHCLLVSLDQTPTNVISSELGSARRCSSLGNGETSDGMWLHKWFVRTLLPSTANDNSYIALDWLVAYITASRGTITKLVLHDLTEDLRSFKDGDEQPPVATYIRRTGVLEYAALRKPELREPFIRLCLLPWCSQHPHMRMGRMQRKFLVELVHVCQDLVECLGLAGKSRFICCPHVSTVMQARSIGCLLQMLLNLSAGMKQNSLRFPAQSW